MPPPTKLTSPLSLVVTAEPLARGPFAPFGDVIENPHPDVLPSATLPPAVSASFSAVPANQGTAIKYQNVSSPLDLYPQAPSAAPGTGTGTGSAAKPIVSIFSCAARALDPPSPAPAPPISTLLPYTYAGGPSRAGLFHVRILERHPFTTQTFTPFAASASASATPSAAYLVIVAPTLPASPADSSLPAPAMGGKGRGLPDLRRLRAFVASPGQAVTYGAGTWHAPMVALGPPGSAVDFVVTQFASGVAVEDCQEVELAPEGEGEGVVVQVPERTPVAAKL
ncbi:Ureidoglycolate hydrolase [Colletotrichum higginsianum IMI 349063]|uniref:Ureidoglycolate hydrolase n=2 Tax=Colletotrichum higginsianum TaxID=80884 RepID=A0A1B7Y6X3_COLHI|nr:Ureidoglycolate hydrolase [Colletotrichum higginsianum IMI 349063]OBR07735.1 Ureidoglycolate hydrolase [Colletotrichum higginsianum IMI 349063]TIC91535.1 Ureidoglycolate lyase [Colletotrichum higginsianum]GJC98168.1 ureidoglycolate hydrolase [Colletotrichum higginsianum]